MKPVVTDRPTEPSIEPNDAYTTAFFQKVDVESRSSAEVIVPLAMKLLFPASVVDFGCGHGVWLSVFREGGVERILGIDGPWVEQHRLAIPADRFRTADLAARWTSDEAFDLAVCLEVAEHLPAKSAPALVQSLAEAAPAVLFSAAIPGQQGTRHLNERWPEYWQRLFVECGHVRLDPFRRRIWQDPRVAWYYQQNLYLYVAPSLLEQSPPLQQEHERAQQCELTLVHRKILRPMKQFRPAAKLLPRLAWQAIRRRLGARP
jgi:hypothetical protein